MSGFKFKIQIQSNPTFRTKDSKRILQFAPSKSKSRSRKCVLAHHRCVINQQLKSLESRIGSSAVARANEERGHQPKMGEGALKFAYTNWSPDLKRLQLCAILKQGRPRFLARFVCGQQSLEKSIYSSKCYQTCDQDFAKRGEQKVNFFSTKTA